MSADYTSNKDLKQAVAQHEFREDLFYRLNVFPLVWVPLKQRPGDILPIAHYLIARYAKENQRAIPELAQAAEQQLLRYAWPGNVRELDNVIQRALILCPGQTLLPEHLFWSQLLSLQDLLCLLSIVHRLP